MKSFVLSCFTLFLFIGISAFAKDGSKDKINIINKTLAQVARTYLDINNISTQIYNNGISDIDPNGNAGFVYPKGTGKTCVFTSGLLWGGLVQGDPQPRVGGTTYRTGLQPGAILSNGQADDPTLDKYRIYRVRSDVKPGGPVVDLSAEATNENTTVSVLQQQFEKDWTEWPASLGAPYNDVNHNGVYDPTVDVPGVPGAAQSIFYVANDLNQSLTTNLYGSSPIGIELHTIMWTYGKIENFDNIYFRKYQLINKSSLPVSDMYISLWSDPDIGDAGDDFAGCDTTLNLGYGYNASPIDQIYERNPPVVGFQLLECPLAAGTSPDTGYFNNRTIIGKKNIPMTAFYYFTNSDPN